MYFSLLPNLKYDKKPVQYPFSESDYVTVKNFFKRFQINPDVFSYTVFFQKYSISDGERIEALAETAYGNPLYDWIIILTNNLVNPSFEWPLSSNDLRKHVEKNYDDPYTTIRHYEIVDEETQIENYGRVLYPPGTRVDETFHNTARRFVADTKPEYINPAVNIPNVKYDFSKYDGTPNILSSSGVLIRLGGTGVGNIGGFNIGKHIAFSGTSSQRYAIFNPVDTTNVYKVVVRGIRGSDVNGGEVPDIINSENLVLQYRNDQFSSWTNIGTVIDVDPTNESLLYLPTGLTDYVLDFPVEARSENTYFRLVQPSNSGTQFDHYGIVSIEFVQIPGPESEIPTYTTYEIINSTYHIIDGVDWIYEDNTWKRRVSTGIKFNDNGVVTEVSGSSLSTAVSIYEHEYRENEKKREIYLLKPIYLQAFMDDLKKQSKYKRSSAFVSAKLKETNK